MKKRHKNIFVTLLLSTVLMLGACSDNSTLAMSDSPERVQDGTVSLEYYIQLDKFYNESANYLEKINPLLLLEADDNEVIYQKKFSEELEGLLDEYNDVLSSFTTKPKTRADKEIDLQFQKVVRFQMDFNNFHIEYLKTKDIDTAREANLTMTMLGGMIKSLGEAVDEHDLFDMD